MSAVVVVTPEELEAIVARAVRKVLDEQPPEPEPEGVEKRQARIRKRLRAMGHGQ